MSLEGHLLGPDKQPSDSYGVAQGRGYGHLDLTMLLVMRAARGSGLSISLNTSSSRKGAETMIAPAYYSRYRLEVSCSLRRG